MTGSKGVVSDLGGSGNARTVLEAIDLPVLPDVPGRKASGSQCRPGFCGTAKRRWQQGSELVNDPNHVGPGLVKMLLGGEGSGCRATTSVEGEQGGESADVEGGNDGESTPAGAGVE